jgi:dipeptidyl aminopeptidase/acylaminoacyl peptidase
MLRTRSSARVTARAAATACLIVAILVPAALSAPPATPPAPAPPAAPAAPKPLSAVDIAQLRTVGEVEISPDGALVAYTLGVPRRPGIDDNGGAWAELWVVGRDGRNARGFVTGKVNVSALRFSPDGALVTYLAKRGDDKQRQVWALPLAGGESFKLTAAKSDVESYDWRPDGRALAYVAADPLPKEQENLREKGFKQEVYEEDWQPRRVVLQPLAVSDGGAVTGPSGEPRTFEKLPGQPWAVAFSPDGARLLTDLSPRPLVDDQYMARVLHVVDATSGAVLGKVDHAGKLGPFDFSADGRSIVFVAAADINDHQAGRLMAAPAPGGAPRDLLPTLEGHVEAFRATSGGELVYLAGVGTGTRLGRVQTDGSGAAILSEANDPVFESLSLDLSGTVAALAGESPTHPREVFALSLSGGAATRRLTDSNPWLAERRLAKQEVLRYPARDGLMIEGILIRPLDGKAGARVPLVVIVHGGPEAHYKNGWVTRYSEPGQLLAGEGYAAFYPNYRGSTGRGLAFARAAFGDPVGREFEDVLDGIDALVAQGLADPAKVGITGGSYGGYFTAWAATRYSPRFAAGVMFVGISDTLIKARTTDIPREDELVHMGTTPAANPKLYAERSPITHVSEARTPLLILHGKEDPRVDPSQSRMLYRALKEKGDVPVRLVWYPGEGHGNRNAPARYDYTLRLMQWFDWFLRQGKKDLPPFAIDYQVEPPKAP